MRERPGERPDIEAPEEFLVDGVAPPVIGDGPPEPDDGEAWDDNGRHRTQSDQPAARRQEPADYYGVSHQEPPTSPIPVVRQLPPEQPQQKRKSWVARMFGAPDR